jgi:hypothetical protein
MAFGVLEASLEVEYGHGLIGFRWGGRRHLCSERWSLLAECVPHLMRRMHNGIARGVGPVAKTTADIIDTAANMALAKIIAGRVEIPLRTGAIRIAGGERQRQRQQAQAEQSHINGSFRPSSCPSGGKFQYSGVISNSRANS